MYTLMLYNITGTTAVGLLADAVIKSWSKRVNGPGRLVFRLPAGSANAGAGKIQKYRRVKLLRRQQDGTDAVVWSGFIEAHKRLTAAEYEVYCAGLLQLFKHRYTAKDEEFSGAGSTEAFGLLTAANSDDDTGITAGTGGVLSTRDVKASGYQDILGTWEDLAKAHGAEFAIDDEEQTFDFVPSLGTDKSATVQLIYRTDEPGSTVVGLTEGEDGMPLRNRIIATNSAATLTSTQEDASSQTTYGLLVEVKVFNEAQDQTTLDEMAQAYLAQVKQPIADFGAQPRLSERRMDIQTGALAVTGLEYGAIVPGDLVHCDIVTPGQTISADKRVIEILVDVTDGKERVTYTLGEEGVFVTVNSLGSRETGDLQRRVLKLEQTTGAAAGGGTPSDASYVVLGVDGTLTNERVLTGTGNQITVTDGGAGGNVTLSLPQNMHTGASPTFAGLTLSGLTQGSIVFAGASGVLSQDNTYFFWNNTNKRLGLGTATPSQRLDVAGNLTFANTVTNANNLLNNGVAYGRATSDGTYYQYGQQLEQRVSVATGVTNAGAARGMFNNTLRNFDTGVASDGGTLSALYGLSTHFGHYNSLSGESPLTTNAYGVYAKPYIATGAITNLYGLYLDSPYPGGTITNYYGVYQADGSAKNFLAGSINVGTLGTIPTGCKLYVKSTSPDLVLEATTTTTTTVGDKDSRIILLNNSSTVNGGGEIVLGCAADTTTGRYVAIGSDIKANTSAQARGDFYIATKTNTSDTALTRRLVVLADGNVGIGTTTPATQLHIYNGAANATLFLDAPSGLNDVLYFGTSGTANWNIQRPSSSTDLRVVDNSTGNATMTFKTGGKVGIATTSPAHLLDINGGSGGAVSVVRLYSTDNTGIDLHTDSSSARAGIIRFRRSTGSFASPSAVVDGSLLGVFGGFGYDGTDYETQATFLRFEVAGTVSTNVVPGRITFWTAPTSGSDAIREVMRIAPTGNLGLGITTTTARFNLQTGATSTIGAIIKGEASQTANLTEWQNSSGTVLTCVDAAGNLGLPTGGNIKVNSANPKRTLVLSASGGNPTTTAGCASPAKIEAGTNDVDYYVLDFDDTTEEHAFWSVAMPDGYDGGTVTATFYWTSAAGASGETVVWGIKGRSWANDEALDQAYGTEVTVADDWIADGDVHVTSETSAITIGGTPAGGEFVTFVVSRKPSDGSDDHSGDARLIAVKIEYGVSTFSD